MLLLVGEMDESWLPLMQELREAGLPAPHPDTVFRGLTERGAVSPYLAVCMWPVASGLLAVVDAATPERDFEQTLVRIDPTEPTDSVVEYLQRTLGNSAGVPA